MNTVVHHPSPSTDQSPLGSSLPSEKENQGPGEERASMTRAALGFNLLKSLGVSGLLFGKDVLQVEGERVGAGHCPPALLSPAPEPLGLLGP